MAHVLIVDDYVVSQRLLSQIFRNAGHSTETAGDGPEALDWLASEPFDMVVLDVSMPEMDGITVLEHIRSDDTYGNPYVIMLTASGEDHVRIRAEQAGADAFLTKPSSSAQVIAVVNELLSGN